MCSPVFSVRGSPDGYIHRFLFNLIANHHGAIKSARIARSDIDSLAVAIFPEKRALRDEIEFHGHSVSPVIPRRILAQDLSGGHETLKICTVRFLEISPIGGPDFRVSLRI